MSSNTRAIDMNSPIPVYYQIELDIKKRIMQKEWQLNQQLPSEAELAEQYHVSRITLRQALAELKKDDIIKKYRGKKAYINSVPTPFIHDLSYVLVSGNSIVDGQKMTAEILEFTKVSPLYPDIAENLRLASEDTAIFFKRLFLLEGIPLAIGKSWLPSNLLPDFTKEKMINNSLSTTLRQKYNIIPAKVEDYLEVVRPTNQESILLKSNNNTPLLLVKGISYLRDGTPLEYSNTLWQGDNVRFHFTLNHTRHGFVMGP